MKQSFLLIIAAIFSAVSFSQKVTDLRIAPTYATNPRASQVFDEINYIPLETTKESLFGTINQLEVTEKYFIVFDNATNAILVFEKNGKFHAKISGRPLNISSFKYAKENDRILVYSVNNKSISADIQNKFEKNTDEALNLYRKFFKLTYYDLDGKKLPAKAPENTFSLANLSSIDLPNGITFSNFAIADEQMRDSSANQLNLYKNGELYQSYFPYNTQRDVAQFGKYLGRSSGFTKSANDTIVYFTRPLEYKIYQLTPHTLTEKYKLIFPMSNTIPQTFFTDNISQEDRRSYFNDNRAIITGISNVYVMNNWLLFKINNNDRNRNTTNNFIYDLRSGNLISLNKTGPDSTCYFLPVFDYPFSYESFKAIDKNYFYTYISSARMFQARDATADKNPEYPEQLKKYFAKGDKRDNPVMVQLKLKQDQ